MTLAMLLAALLASPSLDQARVDLAAGKIERVLFALSPDDAVPAAEASQAAALLVDAARLADARKDRALALQLAQRAARREPKCGAALRLLGEWSLRDTELRLAVQYGQRWVEAEPQSEEAKQFLARAEERERSWTPPPAPPPKKARSWKVALAELKPLPAPRAARVAPSPAQPDIVLYGTTWCGACRQARRWLSDNDLPYVDKDIERDSAAARALARKRREQGVRGRGIPVIEVNGKLLLGFSPAAISAAAGR
jgi:glutaredoxin